MPSPDLDEDDLLVQHRKGQPKNFPGLRTKDSLLDHLHFTHKDVVMLPHATHVVIKERHLSLHSAHGPLAVHTHKPAQKSPASD